MKKIIEWASSANLIDYEVACNIMEERVNNIINKDANELIWLVEHPSIYTAGTSSKDKDLIEKGRFPVYKTGRGGQYTYHGPGQRVIYFMLNLENHEKNIRKFIDKLELLIINTLRDIGVESFTRKDRIGIWVYNENKEEEKIAAIGLRVKKWISYHGISINISPNISHFTSIVPCGISGYGVTSLHDLGKEISMSNFDDYLYKNFLDIFAAKNQTIEIITESKSYE
ncbi:MAG: lipoyl(octanoyl) transferase LipB [Alphaproteobacteria bacterium]|jgi:lipoyl(octanoyl) transferase|tara:strand:+ start:25972 stop:26652 length:681 start_codon:yes stop_codon:yes gene_type:complete